MTIHNIVLSATCVLLLQLVNVRCASIQPRTSSEEKLEDINSVEETISTEGEDTQEKTNPEAKANEQKLNPAADEFGQKSINYETKKPGIYIIFEDESGNGRSELRTGETSENFRGRVLLDYNSETYLHGDGTLEAALNSSQVQDILITESPFSVDETQQQGENISVQEGLDKTGLELASYVKPDLPPVENSSENVDEPGTFEADLHASQVQDKSNPEVDDSKLITSSSTDQSDSQLITDLPSTADETQPPEENIGVQDNSGLELGSSGHLDLPPGENSTEGVPSGDNSENSLDGTSTLEPALNASQAHDQTNTEVEESEPLTISSTDQSDFQLITDLPSTADETQPPEENIGVQDNSGLELGSSDNLDLPAGENSTEGVPSGDNSESNLDGTSTLEPALNASQAHDQTNTEVEESKPLTTSSTDQSDSQLINDSPSTADEIQHPGETISIQEGLGKSGLESGSSSNPDLPAGENSSEGVLSGDNSESYLDGTSTLEPALNASQAHDQTNTEDEESEPLTISSTDQSDSQLITDTPSTADEIQQPGETISIQEGLGNSGLESGSSSNPDLPAGENSSEGVLSGDNSEGYLDGTSTLEPALNASQAHDQTNTEVEESKPLTISSTDQSDSQLITDSPSTADEIQQPGETIRIQEGLGNSGLESGSSSNPDLPAGENSSEGVLSGDNSESYLDGTSTLEPALNASQAHDQTNTEVEESKPLTISSTDQSDSQLITDSPSTADEIQQPEETISIQEGLDNSGLELGSSDNPDLPPGENSSEGVLSGDNSDSYVDATSTLEPALNVSQAHDQTNTEDEESEPLTISSIDQSDSQLITDSPSTADEIQQPGETIRIQEGLGNSGLESGSSSNPDLPAGENSSEGVLSGDNSESYLDGTSTLESALNASQAHEQTNTEVEESKPLTISSTDQSDSQLITDSPSTADEIQQPGETISIQEGLGNSGLESGSSSNPDLPPGENSSEGVLSGDISESYLDGTSTLESALNASQAHDQTNTEVEESKPLTISSTDQSDSQLITDSPSTADEIQQPEETISIQEGLGNSGLESGSSSNPDLPAGENSSEGVLSGDNSEGYLDGTSTLEPALNASQAHDQTNTEVEESKPLTISSTDQSDSQLITDSPSTADEIQQPEETISIQEGLDNSGLELGSSDNPDLPPGENSSEGVLSGDNSDSYVDATSTLEPSLNVSQAHDQTNTEDEESEPLTISSIDQSDSQLITDSPSTADEIQQPGETIRIQEGLGNSGLESGSSSNPDLPAGENSSEGVLSGDNSESYLDGTSSLESALNASQAHEQTNTEVEESKPLTISSTDQSDSQLITDSPSTADEIQQPGETISIQEGLGNSGLESGSSSNPDLPPVENSSEGVLSGDISESYLDGTSTLESALNASQAHDQTNTEVEESKPLTISSTDQSDSQLITDSPSTADEIQQPEETISIQEGLGNSGLESGSSGNPDLPPGENSSKGVLSGDNSESYVDATSTLEQALNASQAHDQTNTEVEESEPLTISSTDQSDSQLITDSPSTADEIQQPGETISIQEGLGNSGLEPGSSSNPDLPPGENSSEGVLSGDISESYLDWTSTLESALNASQGHDQNNTEVEESEPLTISSTDQSDSQLITDSPAKADEIQQPGETISIQEGLGNSGLESGSSSNPDSLPGENSSEGVLSGDNSEGYVDATSTLEPALNASQAHDQTNTEDEESEPLTISSTDQSDSQLITDSSSTADEIQQPGETISIQGGLDNTGLELGSSGNPDLPPGENSSEGVLSGDNSETYVDATSTLEQVLNASQAHDQTNTEVEESEPLTISSTDQSDSQLIIDSPSTADEIQKPGETISIQEGLGNSGLESGSSSNPDSLPGENSSEGVLSGDNSEGYLDGTSTLEPALRASQAHDQTNTEVEESEPLIISSTDQSDSQLITDSPSTADEIQQTGETISIQGLGTSGLESGSSGNPDLPPGENSSEGVLSGDSSESYLDETSTLDSAINSSQARDQTNTEVEESKPLTISSTNQSDSQLITDSPSTVDETQQPGENISVQEGLDKSGLELASYVKPDLPPGENSSENVDAPDTFEVDLNASQVQDKSYPEVDDSKLITSSSADQSDTQLINHSPSTADETQQPAQSITVQEGLGNSGLELGSSGEADFPPGENYSRSDFSGEKSESYRDGTSTLQATVNSGQAKDKANTEFEESKPITSSAKQSDLQLISVSPFSSDETQEQKQKNFVQEESGNTGLELGTSCETDSGGQPNQGGSQSSGGKPNLGGSEILSAEPSQTGPQCSDGSIQDSNQSSVSESARNSSQIEGGSQGNSELESSFYGSQEQENDGDAPIAGNPDYPGSPMAADDLINKLNRGGSSKMRIYKNQFPLNINREAESSKPINTSSTDHSQSESNSEQEYNGDAPIAGNPDNPGSPMAADDLISQLNRGGSAKKGIKESQPLEKTIPEANDTNIITILSAIKSQPETTTEQGNNGDAPIAGNPDNPGSPLAADDLLSLLNRGGFSKKDLNQIQFQYKTNPEVEESEIKATSSTDKSQLKSNNQPENNSDAPIMRNTDNPGSPQAADDLLSDLMVNGR